MSEQQLSLHEKALAAAASLSDGDLSVTFTVEDLLIRAWKEDTLAWGLRGHESEHPDSNKLYTKTDGRDGLVDRGFLKNVGPRTYQITEAGLAYAQRLAPQAGDSQGKLERQVQDRVLQLIEHPVFQRWLQDPRSPTKFREAGLFWGIAPGIPAKAVRARVASVEQVLETALSLLSKGIASEIVKERGSRFRFTREDIQRCLEFQSVLRDRFRKDLKILDPEGAYARSLETTESTVSE